MPSQDKDDASPSGQISSQDRAAIRGRADDLGRRLKDARGDESDANTGPLGRGASEADVASRNKAMGKALRMSTEMIGGVLVGAGLGWLLDQWLGTWPAFFIVFFLLGSAAGMLNVVRAGMNMKTGPLDPSKGPSVPDDDDDS